MRIAQRDLRIGIARSETTAGCARQVSTSTAARIAVSSISEVQVQKGEQSTQAVLSDAEVEQIRTLYERDRDKPRAERYWTLPRLAEKFETSLRNVNYIVRYQRRA
jgi:hypothetical protein